MQYTGASPPLVLGSISALANLVSMHSSETVLSYTVAGFHVLLRCRRVLGSEVIAVRCQSRGVQTSKFFFSSFFPLSPQSSEGAHSHAC